PAPATTAAPLRRTPCSAHQARSAPAGAALRFAPAPLRTAQALATGPSRPDRSSQSEPAAPRPAPTPAPPPPRARHSPPPPPAPPPRGHAQTPPPRPGPGTATPRAGPRAPSASRHASPAVYAPGPADPSVPVTDENNTKKSKSAPRVSASKWHAPPTFGVS